MKIQEVIKTLESFNCFWSIDRHPEFGYSLRIYKKKNFKVEYIKIFTGKTLEDCILNFTDYISSVGSYV